jgi:magnesium chelatase family protein
MSSLIGSGLKVKTARSLVAHLGVLFLDELPEFHGIR